MSFISSCLSISEISPENRMNHRFIDDTDSLTFLIHPAVIRIRAGESEGRPAVVLGSSRIILISTEGAVFTPTSGPGLAAVTFGPIRGQTPGAGGQSRPGFLLTVVALH